jgi:serine/threonine protein kinase
MTPPIDPTILPPKAPSATTPQPVRDGDVMVPLTQSDTLVSAPSTTPQRVPVIPGYENLKLIGRGAVGAVYRATQVKLNRPVALKVLLGQAFASPEDEARFRAEALTVARIQHPNVIQIFDIGEDSEVPFLAVEYLEGGTLEQRLTGQPMTIPDALRLVYQIARGVGAAHVKGVIHRDLKPANILLTAEGAPKVADFGLAKQLGVESNTMTGSVLGTPAYMAPEQAAGQLRQLSPRTDVYALGVILYQCLTGVAPHRGDSILQTLERVRTEVPLPVRYHRQEIPDVLEEVVSRCLRKAPAERYATADALADDLARVANAWNKARLSPAKPPREATLALLAVFAAIAALVLFGWYLARDAGWFTPAPRGPIDIPQSSTPGVTVPAVRLPAP